MPDPNAVRPSGRRLVWGILGVVGALATTFLSTRHVVWESGPQVEVSGREIQLPWSGPASGIGPDDGLTSARTWITNATVTDSKSPPFDASADRWSATQVTANGRSQVFFKPGPYILVQQPLVLRRVRNIWGLELVKWECRLEGAISADGSEYAFSLRPTGGGDDGFATRVDGHYDPGSRIFTLRLAEKLWRSEGKQFELRFKLDASGNALSLDPIRQS